MTCPHCAALPRTTLAAPEEEIYRHRQGALHPARVPARPAGHRRFMLARCAGDDKYYAMIDLLFAQQKNWAFVDAPEALPAMYRSQASRFHTGTVREVLEGQEALYDGVNGVKQRASDKFKVDRRRPSSSTAKRVRRVNCLTAEFDKAVEPLLKSLRPGAPRRGGCSMKLTKLRLLGFKSFVEATDFLIEPGLTGVVGPERLRQVQPRRGPALGDGRELAQDHARRRHGRRHLRRLRHPPGAQHRRGLARRSTTPTARRPAAFNDADVLEVSRRIEREHGSTYRINGREVRARDVQLLFADASTGARSPALVRQGQIGELIAAKPQARRRILEEAAGIAGLHTRRHEAELRLKRAEQNLERLEDVIGQIDSQLDGLQAPGAAGGRATAASPPRSARPRRSCFTLRWREAERGERGRARIEADVRASSPSAREPQAAAARRRGRARRMSCRRCARRRPRPRAALQRLTLARDGARRGGAAGAEARAELDRRIAAARRRPRARGDLIADARRRHRAARRRSEAALAADEAERRAPKAGAGRRLAAASPSVGVAETRGGARSGGLAEQQARRGDAAARARRGGGRLRRARSAEPPTVEREHAARCRDAGGRGRAIAAREARALRGARSAPRRTSRAALAASAHGRRASREARARAQPLQRGRARGAAARDRGATLAKLLAAAPTRQALAADPRHDHGRAAAMRRRSARRSATTSTRRSTAAAAAHWRGAGPGWRRSGPAGGRRAARRACRGAGRARRGASRQIGVVAAAPTARGCAASLKPGQRLVSREGDLWRWDGFVAAAEAPTAAARRLAERNRLADLDGEAEAARAEASAAQARPTRRSAELAQPPPKQSAARAAVRERDAT